jgi:Ca-activated chloride channel family protein
LTDGVNNSGTIDPRTAAEIAKEYGIKVYTIGIGTNGNALFPVAKDANGKLVFRRMPVEIDQKLMQEIAKTTNAKYYRATSNRKLEAIYDEINKLETTEINEQKFYNYDEKYKTFAFIAFVLLGIELVARNTVFRGIL